MQQQLFPLKPLKETERKVQLIKPVADKGESSWGSTLTWKKKGGRPRIRAKGPKKRGGPKLGQMTAGTEF